MDTGILSNKEVAEYLEIREAACRFAAVDELPGLKVGGSWHLRYGDIRFRIDRQWAEPMEERDG